MAGVSTTFGVDYTGIDPPSVTFAWQRPDGRVSVYAYGTDPEISRSGAGLYTATVGVRLSGTYRYNWNPAGTNVTVLGPSSGSFVAQSLDATQPQEQYANIAGVHTGAGLALPDDTLVMPAIAVAGRAGFVYKGSRASVSGMARGFFCRFHDCPDEATYPLSYFTTTHPDWVLYLADGKTPAWTDPVGGRAIAPLDVSNPAVTQWIFDTFCAPALADQYDTISFDVVSAVNTRGASMVRDPMRGDMYLKYGGPASVGTYQADVVSAYSRTIRLIKSGFPGSLVAANVSFSADHDSYSAWQALAQLTDIIFDEEGFTHAGKAPSYPGTASYLTTATSPYNGSQNPWLDKVTSYGYLQGLGKALHLSGLVPYDRASSPQAIDTDWMMANYFLTKWDESFISLNGRWPDSSPQYGRIFSNFYGESIPIGAPTGPAYPVGGAYLRGFTNGLVIVNPTTAGVTIFLEQHKYVDRNGASLPNFAGSDQVAVSPASNPSSLAYPPGTILLLSGTVIPWATTPPVWEQEAVFGGMGSEFGGLLIGLQQ